ncbi:hypothetical protein L596_002057 [Steinernema carpocapsae]|uniref:Uncharacterized protein n=1 Tax=Steinernema carpocapsae TaxID=34508 RepID=A0A4V6YSU5_STECR|nr:hypothetical protein L596_002057 [Steinernema carpocapsae]
MCVNVDVRMISHDFHPSISGICRFLCSGSASGNSRIRAEAGTYGKRHHFRREECVTIEVLFMFWLRIYWKE